MIDAHIVLRDDKVDAEEVPASRFFEVVVSSDAEYYIQSLSYTKPGTLPYRFATKSNTAVPKIAACVKITATHLLTNPRDQRRLRSHLSGLHRAQQALFDDVR